MDISVGSVTFCNSAPSLIRHIAIERNVMEDGKIIKREERPCEEDPDGSYDFMVCVKNSQVE